MKHQVKTINIENNLQNIDKKLAEQANEQMKSIKITDSSVKVL